MSNLSDHLSIPWPGIIRSKDPFQFTFVFTVDILSNRRMAFKIKKYSLGLNCLLFCRD